MHRIIIARNFYPSNFNSISISSNNSSIGSNPEIKCSFCRKILFGKPNTVSLFLSRHQSTRAASITKSPKKKGKHKGYKRYGELLEVSEKTMTETKVSISNLRPIHLSKLASSSVSLNQLHQLTTKVPKKVTTKEVDPELLQRVKEKILNKSIPSISPVTKEISLEDDRCALVYTTQSISSTEHRFKTKQFIDMVKESYYNFRKATIYDQRLQDLRYAINEGLTQQFDLSTTGSKCDLDSAQFNATLPRSPHAVFRELFVDNQLDAYDQELMTHISSLQAQGLAHPALEDLEDDSGLLGEPEHRQETEYEPTPQLTTLNIKKAKQAQRQKKKARREQRRLQQERSMKREMQDVARDGKHQALINTLHAHLRLLCALNVPHEGRQILQYYRRKSARMPDHRKINDVKIYNVLLHGYAFTGQLENTKELLTFMKEDGVVMNAQSFAAVFECIERSGATDKVGLLSVYHRDMMDKSISLNDLLDKTKFLYDQRETVHKAILRLDPDFVPKYTPPLLDYDCTLMENLTLDKVENRKGLLKSPAEGLMSLEEMIQNGKRQLEIEIKGEIEIQNIDVKDEQNPHVKFYRQKLSEAECEWRAVIKEAFVRNLGTLKSQCTASHSAITLYPYLKVLEVEVFVEMLMGEIRKLVDGSETFSPTLKALQRELGTQVYHRYQIEQYRRNGVLDKIEKIYEKYCEWYLSRQSVDGSGLPYNGRQAWQALVHRHREGASLDIEQALWPHDIRQNIGKFLYNIIINDVKIDVNMFKPKAKVKKLPAVYKVHRPWGRLVRLELKPHPALSRLWSGAAVPGLRMRAPLAPTAAPPRPWLDATQGAYLLTPTSLIRLPSYISSQSQLHQQRDSGALYAPLDSLNQLGEVPWRVNTRILHYQLTVFRSGGNKKLDIPPPASSLDMSQFNDGGHGNDAAAAAFKRRLAVNRARAEMHSLWCDALYKLSLANHYRDSIFWLPHNMDFRGRVYACPPHLSQLGADTARALLLFAEQRPLGPHGLRWLKLHAVNLTGTMKSNTIQERLEYAESILDLMLDSADHPLDGAGWWTRSEEPWQTLACCMEIADAIRSPNHEEYMSGFPVHQDGSCNGLQHYAALGGDSQGARAVNLAPDHRPQDVYTAVAAKVEEMRARDAAAGVPAAIVLEKFVRRKVIKQTVMTTVYGVTRFGARLQIAKQLKDIEEFPKEHVWACSQYLTARTFDSLREMFTSTKQIQDWFTECARMISGVCGESVSWTTPLGLPVLQPYYRRPGPHSQRNATTDTQQRPCTMKQRNAFPPNFIHSLDSTHMMLTGLHCQAAGCAFVSVHDCFWTHPHTAPHMNQICREQFVALHSQPILEDLSEFLVKKYSYDDSELDKDSRGACNKRRVNNLLRQVPGKGDFDLNSVLDSVYFFS